MFFQITFVSLTELPGITDAIDGTFAEYFNSLFDLALAGGAVLAVIMIAIGGLQYMTTEAAGAKTESKKRITNALLGLIVLLGTYIIFNQINPNLLNLNINPPAGAKDFSASSQSESASAGRGGNSGVGGGGGF